MLFGLFLSVALADTLTLESGATLQGQLAVYQYGGDCQISVTEGDLRGSIVIVPCAQIARLERSAADFAPVARVQTEELSDPPVVAAAPAAETPADEPAEAPSTDVLPDTFAAQIPGPEVAETPTAQPQNLDGVPMDAAVTVDPGLLPDGRPVGRVQSPPRPPTSRPAGAPAAMPLAIPPNPDGTANIGW